MGYVLDIAFILYALFTIITYGVRGFFRDIAYTLRWIFSILAAYFFGGKLSLFLQEKWIDGTVSDLLHKLLNSVYEKNGENSAATIFDKLPAFLQTEELYDQLFSIQGTGEEWVSSATATLSGTLSVLISNVLGYVAIFLAACIVFWVIAKLVDHLIKESVELTALNVVFGVVWGIVNAGIIGIMIASFFRGFFATSPLYTESVIIRFFGETPFFQNIKFFDIGGMLLERLFLS